MITPSAQQALAILRDGQQFQWTILPVFALVVYVYSVEVERRNWRLVFAGLAFWGMDWLNEIANALFFHWSQYAPLWGAPGKTAYLLLIGLNIEICLMFAIAGIGFCKMLPQQRALRIAGIPNRAFIAATGSLSCVMVEYWLNGIGALRWEYAWWNREAPWLIFLIGYLPFFLVSFYVYDLESRQRQLGVLGLIYGLAGAAMLVFGGWLGWL
ncbi:TM2 domain-containing membrane protein YozV [Oxalobacteraceae bacterium GrIS 1.11]